MKKTYAFFACFGKVFLIIDLLFLVSLCMYSVSIKGRVNYGDRCYVSDDFNTIKAYSVEGIKLVEEELKCNTYVMHYKSKLTSDGNILFLNDISRLLYESDIESDVSVTIVSLNHQIVASIVDYQVNYVISEI